MGIQEEGGVEILPLLSPKPEKNKQKSENIILTKVTVQEAPK